MVRYNTQGLEKGKHRIEIENKAALVVSHPMLFLLCTRVYTRHSFFFSFFFSLHLFLLSSVFFFGLGIMSPRNLASAGERFYLDRLREFLSTLSVRGSVLSHNLIADLSPFSTGLA